MLTAFTFGKFCDSSIATYMITSLGLQKYIRRLLAKHISDDNIIYIYGGNIIFVLAVVNEDCANGLTLRTSRIGN